MAKKIALLIGVGNYGAGLELLRCPKDGVAAMRRVLQDPEIGDFDEIISLIDPDVGEMRSRICEVFAQLTKQDLILFYFTGHGLKDMTGDFYLTTSQTQLFANGRPNAGTAIEADFLKREVANCLAERKIIVLDCCFGAAFAGGFLAMNDNTVDVEAQLGGKGWCVMTASTSSRYALEQSGEPLSVYTRYLVEGLRTGAAAEAGQRFITARHWHEYVKRRVKSEMPAMEPAMFSGQQGYDIAIAKAKIDRFYQYRQQVESKIRNGTIGPAARAILRQWQQHCQLSDEQVEGIEATVLQPYQRAQQQLVIYTQALQAEKRIAYPLRPSSVQDLRDLQRLLKLTDEETHLAQQQVLGNRIHAMSDNSPSAFRRVSTPQLFSPRVYSQSVIAAAQSTIQLSTNPTKREPFEKVGRSLYSIEFETLKVDRYGEPTETIKGKVSAFTEDLGGGISLEMIQIPAGTFMMGAARAEGDASGAGNLQRKVTIPSFWMGKYTITQLQWRQFLASKKGTVLESCQPLPLGERADQPINGISWPEAVDFCHWLSQMSGRDYRLPSPAQWEYACRANTTTPFYFGETITSDLANYNGNYSYGQGPRGCDRQQMSDVGSFVPNGFGLYDMHGNVWEWCLDNWHIACPGGFPYDVDSGDVARRLSGQTKVLRGGSWFYQPTDCRSAHRLSYPFHSRTDDIGFRVVCISSDR